MIDEFTVEDERWWVDMAGALLIVIGLPLLAVGIALTIAGVVKGSFLDIGLGVAALLVFVGLVVAVALPPRPRIETPQERLERKWGVTLRD